ncbi:class I SAM-dependent methyltransferase [Candidatus Altiarchaeota archaeon]
MSRHKQTGKKAPEGLPTPRILGDSELSGLLKAQLHFDRRGAYDADFVSRGIFGPRFNNEDVGYNEIHGVAFHEIVPEAVRQGQGLVRLLDAGCGAGVFVEEIQAVVDKDPTLKGRFNAMGLALTRRLTYREPDGKHEVVTVDLAPQIKAGTIKVGHAEDMPFQDEFFNLLVETQGPLAYYSKHPERRLKVYNEYYRVLAPGGVMFLADKHGTGYLDKEDKLKGGALRGFIQEHPDAYLETPKTGGSFSLPAVQRLHIRKPVTH